MRAEVVRPEQRWRVRAAVGREDYPDLSERGRAVLLILFAVLTLGFITSLLPFMYPDTIMNVLGAHLNVVLGELIATWVPSVRGTLVSVAKETHALTLPGVFAVYGAPLMLILVALRNR